MKTNEHKRILLVSFEDNKANPVANVKRIAKFLDFDISDELAVEIVSQSSFSSMKTKRDAESRGQLLRKGKCAGMKSLFIYSHSLHCALLVLLSDIQWKPVKVTPLKVNNRLTSTTYVGPVLSALYFSNLNPDNVNHLRP